MYESMFKQAESSAQNKSKLFEQLNDQEKRDVTGFLGWLEDHTSFSQNSRNSYKTYICQAMLIDRGVLPGPLVSDQKSGVRKFAEYLAWRKAQAAAKEAPKA